MLRGERPEATAKLIDGALAVLQVLRGLVAGAGQPPARADQSGGAVSDQPSDQAGSTGAAGPANGEYDAAAARAADGASRDGSVVRIDIR
jgi:hypothetical protein